MRSGFPVTYIFRWRNYSMLLTTKGVPKMCKAVSLALIIAGTASSFASAAELPTVRVRINQYNLQTEDGLRAVLSKLSSAAQHVCGVGESRILTDEALAAQCYRETLSNAVQSVRSEQLTALYMARAKGGAS
jgi:UrcA family protein